MVQVIINGQSIGQITHANLDIYLQMSNATVVSRTDAVIVLKG